MKNYHHFDPDNIDPVFLKQRSKELKDAESGAGGLWFIVIILFLLVLVASIFILPFVNF